jgi:bifunctional DNA-binding transcriptional regulator/antitoxin component of YhaV-PrlF toxin-antitoxin module
LKVREVDRIFALLSALQVRQPLYLSFVPTLKITAKRQATLPKETCEALRLVPGDTIDLEQREEQGETVWVLRPKKQVRRKWVARLAGRVKPGTDHSLDAIRKSVAAARKTSK